MPCSHPICILWFDGNCFLRDGNASFSFKVACRAVIFSPDWNWFLGLFVPIRIFMSLQALDRGCSDGLKRIADGPLSGVEWSV